VRAPSNTLVQALAGTAFGLAALVTDPVFEAGVVYDVLALVLAQWRLWASELTYLALACGAVVLVKFAVFRVTVYEARRGLEGEERNIQTGP
jgi:hypothetical protein